MTTAQQPSRCTVSQRPKAQTHEERVDWPLISTNQSSSERLLQLEPQDSGLSNIFETRVSLVNDDEGAAISYTHLPFPVRPTPWTERLKMLQSRVLLRSQKTQCLNLAFRPHPRSYATVAPTISSEPATAFTSTTAAQESYAPPAVVVDANATFAMRTYTPRTPGVRHLKRAINDHLWKGRPFLPLTFPKKGHGKGGRNNSGRVTVRHMGGGHKRRIRTVDFMRMTPGPHTVERIEHDPGRTAHIALLNEEATGRKSYIVAAEGMRAGDVVQSYRSGIPKDLLESMGGVVDPGVLAAKTAWRGNCLPLHMVPIGSIVYNVGSKNDRGAVFCRSAGTYATVISKDEGAKPGKKDKYVVVKLQSGEIRKVDRDSCATIGVASNPHYQHEQLGKAGRSRWLNIRPTVRGLAMNACKYS